MLKLRKMKGSKKAILIIVVILVIGIIAYLIYTNFISSQDVSNQPVKNKINISQLPATPPLNPDFSDDFLTKSPYINLKLPRQGLLPVVPNKVGKGNPFSKPPELIIGF